MKKLRYLVSILVGILVPTIVVYAVVLQQLNGQAAKEQFFSTGTAGNDFNIVSSNAVHTFNIPDASISSRGLMTLGTQSFAGVKIFEDNVYLMGGANSIKEMLNFGPVHWKNEIAHLQDIGGGTEIFYDASGVAIRQPFFARPGPPTGPPGGGGVDFVVNSGEWIKGITITNSDVKIGNGCLVLVDSDGAGVTYITANDGLLSATTTKPDNCQFGYVTSP